MIDKDHVQTNPGKPLIIQGSTGRYLRKTIRTHFITTEDNYLNLINHYVLPEYQKGDILAISEKIIAIMQNRLVYMEQIRLSYIAKFLSKFVQVTPAGKGVGNPYKMQVALESAGTSKILMAAFVSAITKPLGFRGAFYKIVGNNVWAIDGFNSLAYNYYQDKGVLTPENPNKICNEIEQQLGINTIIVDANDLNVEILGKSVGVDLDEDILREILIDNPAGQKDEQTPLILIREV